MAVGTAFISAIISYSAHWELTLKAGSSLRPSVSPTELPYQPWGSTPQELGPAQRPVDVTDSGHMRKVTVLPLPDFRSFFPSPQGNVGVKSFQRRTWHGWDREGERKCLLQRKQCVQKEQSLKQPVPQETRSAAWAGAETSGQAPGQQRLPVRVLLHRLVRNADSQGVPGLLPQQLWGWGPASPVLTSTPANCGTW